MIPRTLPGAALASSWAYRPPRLQPTKLTRRPELRCNRSRRERSCSTTCPVGPRFLPRLQPDTLWPSARRTLRSGTVAGSPVSHPGNTRTGWPSPRRAVVSIGHTAARTARSSAARGGSEASSAREGTRLTVATGPASLSWIRPPRKVGRDLPARASAPDGSGRTGSAVPSRRRRRTDRATAVGGSHQRRPGVSEAAFCPRAAHLGTRGRRGQERRSLHASRLQNQRRRSSAQRSTLDLRTVLEQGFAPDAWMVEP